ncbi:MAG TPA: MoaD/ThiS family protein [Cytophagaceae bacterium]|jgi:molybdopterin converting factor small subunit|nr:MoaD/ThiS family protein [Cytophagaceae bacterium]
MSKIEIQVFAVLKDYFKPTFKLTTSISSLEELKIELTKLNPASATVLHACRFAVNENFVSKDYKLKENDKVSIIPPSSGG